MLNSMAQPNRRKSLDPRAMNKTISHSSGHALLSDRQKNSNNNYNIGASRQASLADVKALAKQAKYLDSSLNAKTLDYN